MTSDPFLDVVAHPPRYMVRCSQCGIVAVQLELAEIDGVRNGHVCAASHPWRRHATSVDDREPCGDCGVYKEFHATGGSNGTS